MNRVTRRLPVSVRIFLHEWGALLWIAGIVAVLGIAGLIYQASLGPNESAGFYRARVEATFDVSTDTLYRVRAVVILPDGTRGTVLARTINEAQWLIDTACVEHRVRRDGSGFYRLAAPARCGP